MKITVDEAAANAIYDILVEECGARDDPTDQFGGDRYLVTRYLTERGERSKEYRFMGALGFGGKIKINSNGVYVDTYREDETDERLVMIGKANVRLEKIAAGLQATEPQDLKPERQVLTIRVVVETVEDQDAVERAVNEQVYSALHRTSRIRRVFSVETKTAARE